MTCVCVLLSWWRWCSIAVLAWVVMFWVCLAMPPHIYRHTMMGFWTESAVYHRFRCYRTAYRAMRFRIPMEMNNLKTGCTNLDKLLIAASTRIYRRWTPMSSSLFCERNPRFHTDLRLVYNSSYAQCLNNEATFSIFTLPSNFIQTVTSMFLWPCIFLLLTIVYGTWTDILYDDGGTG